MSEINLLPSLAAAQDHSQTSTSALEPPISLALSSNSTWSASRLISSHRERDPPVLPLLVLWKLTVRLLELRAPPALLDQSTETEVGIESWESVDGVGEGGSDDGEGNTRIEVAAITSVSLGTRLSRCRCSPSRSSRVSRCCPVLRDFLGK